MAESAIERLKAKENPVVYSGGNVASDTAHIPVNGEDGLRTLCRVDPDNLLSSSLPAFQRRRDPSLCKNCQVYLLVEDGGENVLTDPDRLLREFEGLSLNRLLKGEIRSGEVINIPGKEVV